MPLKVEDLAYFAGHDIAAIRSEWAAGRFSYTLRGLVFTVSAPGLEEAIREGFDFTGSNPWFHFGIKPYLRVYPWSDLEGHDLQAQTDERRELENDEAIEYGRNLVSQIVLTAIPRAFGYQVGDPTLDFDEVRAETLAIFDRWIVASGYLDVATPKPTTLEKLNSPFRKHLNN